MHEAQTIVDQAQERISELRDELGAAKGEYDRAVNKVDAMQLRLNAAEQRIDDLLAEIATVRQGPCKMIAGDELP